MAAFIEQVPDVVRAVNPRATTWLFGHVADGNVHVNITGVDPDDVAVDDCVLVLAAGMGGSISAEHGIGTAKRPWLHLNRSEAEIAAFRRIKDALDPAGILNPHVLFPLGAAGGGAGSDESGGGVGAAAPGLAGSGGGFGPVAATSPWTPLSYRTFRILWLAQLGSNIGSWMQTVATQWLLIDRNASLIALVQTASLLPVFFLSLPAGVFADTLDRKRLLTGATIFMAVLAAALAVSAAFGATGPASC